MLAAVLVLIILNKFNVRAFIPYLLSWNFIMGVYTSVRNSCTIAGVST